MTALTLLPLFQAKKQSKIASKRALEEANLERQFQREEARRKAFLKSSAAEQVGRRKRQSCLDLEFIQSRVSRSAGEYVTKALAQKAARDREKAETARQLEKRMSPTRFRPKGQGYSRPQTARSEAGTRLSGVPLGYRTHTYRSGVRQYLKVPLLTHSPPP